MSISISQPSQKMADLWTKKKTAPKEAKTSELRERLMRTNEMSPNNARISSGCFVVVVVVVVFLSNLLQVTFPLPSKNRKTRCECVIFSSFNSALDTKLRLKSSRDLSLKFEIEIKLKLDLLTLRNCLSRILYIYIHICLRCMLNFLNKNTDI